MPPHCLFFFCQTDVEWNSLKKIDVFFTFKMFIWLNYPLGVMMIGLGVPDCRALSYRKANDRLHDDLIKVFLTPHPHQSPDVWCEATVVQLSRTLVE